MRCGRCYQIIFPCFWHAKNLSKFRMSLATKSNGSTSKSRMFHSEYGTHGSLSSSWFCLQCFGGLLVLGTPDSRVSSTNNVASHTFFKASCNSDFGGSHYHRHIFGCDFASMFLACMLQMKVECSTVIWIKKDSGSWRIAVRFIWCLPSCWWWTDRLPVKPNDLQPTNQLKMDRIQRSWMVSRSELIFIIRLAPTNQAHCHYS